MVNLKRNWHNWIVALGLFLLALIPRIIRLGAFWGTDERYHWQLSNEFFLALLRRDWAHTVPQGLPGLTLAWIDSIAMALKYGWLWLISSGSASLEQVLAPDYPFALLAERQVPVVLVNTLIVVGLYALSWSILGRKAAWVGITFVILDPFLLAESRELRFEALVAGLMPLSLLAALLYLKEQLSLTPTRGLGGEKFLILSAVLAALAMLTKISAIMLLPIVGLLGAATVFGVKKHPVDEVETTNRSAGSSFVRWPLKYLIWVGLILFFFWLFWPAMWVAPLDTLREVTHFVEDAGGEGFEGRGVFFWGQIYPDDPGFWFYPVTLLFRLTPLVLIGVGISLVFLILTFRKWWPIRGETSWQGWGTSTLLVYSLLFVAIMTFGAKKYDRYLLPIYPTLDLAAGVGWLWLGEWLVRRWVRPKQSQPILAIGWGVLLLLQSLTTLPHLPYYYTYYNPLLGGARQAVNYIRVGFAEGLDQVATYLESKPHPAEIKLASGNSSKLKGIFSGQTIALDNLDGKWTQADYVMIYISQLQRGKHSEDILAYLARHEPEYTLELHGLKYVWLYPGPAAQFYGGGYKLEGRGTLFGYDLDKTRLAAGETLPVTLYWRNEGQREDDRFFVRLMDLDGYVWAEAIAQPRPGFEAANRTENAIVESKATLTLPIGMPPGDYFFKPGFRTAGGEIIGYFELPGETKPIEVSPAKAYPAMGAFQPPHPSPFTVNNDLMLLGYDLQPETSSPGSAFWVTLYWQALTDVSHDYVILLRLLDEQQQELAYWLGRPVRSGYPSTEWKTGQVVQDPWLLSLPADISVGQYNLELAVFDAVTETDLIRTQLGALVVSPP